GPLQVDDAAMNQRQRLAFRQLVRELDVGLFQRASKATHPITELADIFAFRFIQDVANVRARIPVGLDDADEILDQLLEEYVVFPERVVRINQQCVASHRELSASVTPLGSLSLAASAHLPRWLRRLPAGLGFWPHLAFSAILPDHRATPQSSKQPRASCCSESLLRPPANDRH